MEMLNDIWMWIITALGGTSVAGIIAGIIAVCLKGSFNKTINKIDVDKISDKAVERAVERIKKVAFEHDITPIAKSELKKVTEEAHEFIKDEHKELKDGQNKILNVLEKFYAYFEDSMVSTEKKQALRQALDEAKIEPTTVKSTVVDEFIEETTNEPIKAKETKKTTKVER